MTSHEYHELKEDDRRLKRGREIKEAIKKINGMRLAGEGGTLYVRTNRKDDPGRRPDSFAFSIPLGHTDPEYDTEPVELKGYALRLALEIQTLLLEVEFAEL